MFATISSSCSIQRSISTRGRAITNDWRISMARAILGNRATSGCDQRPMYDQLLHPTTDLRISRDDRSYDQSWRPATDGTINRCILRPIVEQSWHPACHRSYDHLASYGRAYDLSWGATIDRTINRSVVRPIVATYDRSYDQSWQSWHQTIDRTLNCSIVRAIVRSIVGR